MTQEYEATDDGNGPVDSADGAELHQTDTGGAP